jgi:hypothetical protein
MAYTSFTQIIQFDEKRFIDKYIVPVDKVPEGFVDIFLSVDPDVEDVLAMWDVDDAVIKVSAKTSVNGRGVCLVVPPFLFIERDYVSFLDIV